MSDQLFIRILQDKDEITRRIFEYAKALDSRDWTLLDGLFTDDVQTDFQGIQCQGLSSFKAMVASFLDGCGPSQHLFSNVCIDVDGDKATASFYGRVMHAGLDEQKDVVFDVWCKYEDEWVRTESGWKANVRNQIGFHATGDIGILK